MHYFRKVNNVQRTPYQTIASSVTQKSKFETPLHSTFMAYLQSGKKIEDTEAAVLSVQLLSRPMHISSLS